MAVAARRATAARPPNMKADDWMESAMVSMGLSAPTRPTAFLDLGSELVLETTPENPPTRPPVGLLSLLANVSRLYL